MNITVYLGANEGTPPTLKAAVQELGRWIGESGNALIYGGSRSGLMGALADSVLAAGGKVIGVEPANANCVQESLTSRWKHSVRHIRRKSFTRWSGKAIDQRVFRQICDRTAPKVQMRRKEQISVRAVLM